MTATGMLSSIVETYTMGIKDRSAPDTGAEGCWTKRFRLPLEPRKFDRFVNPNVSPEPLMKNDESECLLIIL